MRPFPEPEVFDDVSPSLETRSLKPLDDWLRRHGAIIHARKGNAEPEWLYKGKVWKQEELEVHLAIHPDMLDSVGRKSKNVR